MATRRHTQLRRFAPAFLEAFEFDAPDAGRSLQAAVELLRELNRSGRRKLPLARSAGGARVCPGNQVVAPGADAGGGESVGGLRTRVARGYGGPVNASDGPSRSARRDSGEKPGMRPHAAMIGSLSDVWSCPASSVPTVGPLSILGRFTYGRRST